MPPESPQPDPARYRPAALAALAAAGALAGLIALVFPAYRPLAAYGLYAIPAHLLISFLPHEPALFYAAKLYPPAAVAGVGTLACVVAIMLDYWLIGWFVNHQLVRPRMESSRWFQLARRWFRKAPFILILGSALAPVPFYPVKILAIASDYPLRRFALALVPGRFPRFWALALAGGQVQASNRSLIWLAGALAAFSAWRLWRIRHLSRDTPDKEPEQE